VQPAVHDKLLTFPGDYIKDTSLAPFSCVPARVLRYLRFNRATELRLAVFSIRQGFAEGRVARQDPQRAESGSVALQETRGKLSSSTTGGRFLVVPPMRIIEYYERVQARWATRNHSRDCFHGAGMNHCGGGPGPNTLDTLARWKNGLSM